MPNRSPDLSRLFYALADPVRRTMVERLSRAPVSVSELAEPLPMSLPSAMQHLVCSEKVGRLRTCSIDSGTLSLAERWINRRRAEWEHRLDRLGNDCAKIPNEEDDDAE
jgi:DNA-binding transcriptional ArsR family regulator